MSERRARFWALGSWVACAKHGFWRQKSSASRFARRALCVRLVPVHAYGVVELRRILSLVVATREWEPSAAPLRPDRDSMSKKRLSMPRAPRLPRLPRRPTRRVGRLGTRGLFSLILVGSGQRPPRAPTPPTRVEGGLRGEIDVGTAHPAEKRPEARTDSGAGGRRLPRRSVGARSKLSKSGFIHAYTNRSSGPFPALFLKNLEIRRERWRGDLTPAATATRLRPRTVFGT